MFRLVICDQCASRLRISATYTNEKVRCPKCDHFIKVRIDQEAPLAKPSTLAIPERVSADFLVELERPLPLLLPAPPSKGASLPAQASPIPRRRAYERSRRPKFSHEASGLQNVLTRLFVIAGLVVMVLFGVKLFGNFQLERIRKLDARAAGFVRLGKYLDAYKTYEELAACHKTGDPTLDELIYQAPVRAKEIKPQALLEKSRASFVKRMKLREEDARKQRSALVGAAAKDTSLEGAESRLRMLLEGLLFRDPHEVTLRRSHIDPASVNWSEIMTPGTTLLRYEIVAGRRAIGPAGYEFSVVLDFQAGEASDVSTTRQISLIPPKTHSNPSDLWKIGVR